jgi:hypothetical protein
MRIDRCGIITFFSLFLLFILSAFLMSLPFAEAFRHYLSALLFYKSNIFFYVGVALLVVFIILTGFLIVSISRPFLSIKMQSHTCSVDTNIIARWLQNYFKITFPDKNIYVEDVVFKKKKLEITVKIIPMKGKELKNFLKKTQNDVAAVLMTNFNYDRDFILTLLSE